MNNKLEQRRKKQHRKQRQELLEDGSVVESLQKMEPRPCMICYLPNDVLRHIVSFLPLESAAKTRLISTQWHNLWDAQLVKQGSLKDANKELATFLYNIDWLNPSTHPWKFQFTIQDGSILNAITGAKNKLQLDSSSKPLDEDQRPRFFLDLEWNTLDSSIQLPLSTIHIKSLLLTSINPEFSKTISSLVSSLPLLESLEIRECASLFCLRIHGGTKLKHLSIRDCPQLGSLSVLAHALKSFDYKGKYPETSVMGICDCKHMALDFRDGPGYKDFNKLSSHSLLLLYFKEAEYITLCRWTFEVMVKPRICSNEKFVTFNKLKTLNWIDNSMEEEKVESLISFLCSCPSLERIFITIDPECYNITRKRNGSDKTNRTEQQLHHLMTIKMIGFKSEDDEIRVCNRMLDMLDMTLDKPVVVTTRSYLEDPSGLKEINMTPKRLK